MRFKLGLITGIAAGYWLGTRNDEERRAELDRLVERITNDPRVERLRETASRNATHVADAVSDRLTGTVDDLGERAEDAVAPGAAG